jgi:hypothetical protein
MATTDTLKIVRGKTLKKLIHWENGDVIVRKPITAISLASGAPRLTATGHGIPNGWKAAVVRVQGMKQINAASEPPSKDDYREVTVIDADTIEFNGTNPVDDSGREWSAYTSGGFLVFFAPMDLTNKRCDVVVKDKVGGTILLSSRAADTPLNLLASTVDNATKTILVRLEASDAAALTWNKAVWEAEMHDEVTNDVDALVAISPVTVTGEIVT